MQHRDLATSRGRRPGKVVVMLAVVLPAVMGVMALVLDAGLIMAERRNLQHVADAAATAAAADLRLGKSESAAIATAEEYVHDYNGRASADLTVSLPPTGGPYAGQANFVEAVVANSVDTHFIHIIAGHAVRQVEARAVAGFEPSTAGAAIVVLDPDPEPVAVESNPMILGGLPAIVAGLEVFGLGEVRVEGAVLVNTAWGGVDENGDPAGDSDGPPYGVSCVPLLPVIRLAASDIRVVGGVDNPDNYGPLDPGDESPLRANRLPVPDPLLDLPVPVTAADANVSGDLHGHVSVMGLPLEAPTTLDPGVYDSLEIESGNVLLKPGVYVIRGVNPNSGVALSITGGTVTADGVMFYITDTEDYSVQLGAPDAADGSAEPAAPEATTQTPSVLINTALTGSTFSALNDPLSVYDGMFIFQRRQDRRPVVIAAEDLLSSGGFSGTVYAKWGHVAVTGKGALDARIVAGTVRIEAALDMTIDPSQPLPPAEDVFLVE